MGAQSIPADIKSALETRYKKRLFYIRGFPSNILLRYDSSGNPLAAVTPGPWTLGLIEVTGVKVNPTDVEFDGFRVGLEWDNKKKTLTPRRVVSDRTKIYISRQADDPGFVNGGWNNVLIPTNQNITDLLPEPWKKFSRLPVGADLKPLNEAEPGVYKVKDDVRPPKPISTPDPHYSEYARKLKRRGTTILSVVIGVDGKPGKIEVVKPLGMGLDEDAINAVQKWTFQPAMKGNEPVPVLINVEVNFSLY